MKIVDYYSARSIEEAYKYVQEHKAVVLGGGAFLNLRKAAIDAAVDISNLGLDFIEERDGNIEIGAMTRLREVETSKLLRNFCGGVIPETAKCIMGVQIRNTATIGGAVWGRFGFSDMLTSLITLDSFVELYNAGRLPLTDFIESGVKDDILTKVIIKRVDGKAHHTNFKITGTSFSALNTTVSNCGGKFKIAVGARPKVAKLAYSAMEYINGVLVNEESAKHAGEIAANELDFGTDIRGSGTYRKELCSVFVKRCIMGVL